MIARKGFTLSEVLLVLSVIGVVAALTIPALVQKVSDDQYKVAWKKAFSQISQATNMIITNNSGSFMNLCADSDDNCLRDKFLQNMSAIKTCDKGLTFNNCWMSTNPGATAASGMVLNDGSALIVRFESNSCSYTAINRCAWFMVDVNGNKPPNKMGQDTFGGIFYRDRVAPFGAVTGDGYDPAVSCVSGADNYGCSSLYLYR